MSSALAVSVEIACTSERQYLRAEFILATNRSSLQHSVPTVNLLHRLTSLLLDLIELLLMPLLPFGSSAFLSFPVIGVGECPVAQLSGLKIQKKTAHR
jgi:hypothetical protein